MRRFLRRHTTLIAFSLSLGASSAFVACGSSDSNTPGNVPDAAAGGASSGGTVGSGGKPASGGAHSSGGAPSSGGSPSSGGAPTDSGSDAVSSNGDAQTD